MDGVTVGLPFGGATGARFVGALLGLGGGTLLIAVPAFVIPDIHQALGTSLVAVAATPSAAGAPMPRRV